MGNWEDGKVVIGATVGKFEGEDEGLVEEGTEEGKFEGMRLGEMVCGIKVEGAPVVGASVDGTCVNGEPVEGAYVEGPAVECAPVGSVVEGDKDVGEEGKLVGKTVVGYVGLKVGDDVWGQRMFQG